MSIDAVVGRIDTILTMQRELLDPASMTQQSTTASSSAIQPAAGAGGGSSTSTSADFGSALSSALGTAEQPAATANQTPFGSASLGGGDARVQAMTNMANSLVGKPYVWSGGHAGFGPSSGYDCSGFVSAVLHAGGYLAQPADTTSLPSQPGILSGPGQSVTIYDRAQPGETGHVIIEIAGQFYESGGETGPWGGGGGVEKINRPSDSYLATFPNVLHPSGL